MDESGCGSTYLFAASVSTSVSLQLLLSLPIRVAHARADDAADVQDHPGNNERDVPHHHKHEPDETIEDLALEDLPGAGKKRAGPGGPAGFPCGLLNRHDRLCRRVLHEIGFAVLAEDGGVLNVFSAEGAFL